MIKEKLKLAIKTYNKIAKIYSKYTFHKISQYQLNKFISMLPKEAKVLDAGCGSGRDAQYFKDYKLDVIGIDAAEKMVEEAKKNVKGVKFKHMNMMDMNFKDKSFDGIWAAASLLNNERADLPKILGELKRVLKDEGSFYVSVKEGEGEEIVKDEKYNNEPRPVVYYKQVEIEEELKKAGFKVVYSSISESKDKTRWIDVFCKKPTS